MIFLEIVKSAITVIILCLKMIISAEELALLLNTGKEREITHVKLALSLQIFNAAHVRT